MNSGFFPLIYRAQETTPDLPIIICVTLAGAEMSLSIKQGDFVKENDI